MIPLSRYRPVFEITHTLDGVLIWTSPAFSADNETDARLQAHAMRSDIDADWSLFGDAPDGHGEAVKLLRDAQA